MMTDKEGEAIERDWLKRKRIDGDDVEKLIKRHDGMIYFNKIIPNLYLGGVEEAKIAKERGFKCIDVRCIFLEGMTWIDAKVLDGFAEIISNHMSLGHKTLVHCHAGIERSPLVVSWYLVVYNWFDDLETAYRHVIDKHPITRRRGQWILWSERKERGMI